MLNKHYAPTTKTVLTTNILQEIEKYKTQKIGVLSFLSSVKSDTIHAEICLSNTQNLQEAAAKLYDALHELDHLNLDVIIVEKLPDFGLGKSMNDRLKRASF